MAVLMGVNKFLNEQKYDGLMLSTLKCCNMLKSAEQLLNLCLTHMLLGSTLTSLTLIKSVL